MPGTVNVLGTERTGTESAALAMKYTEFWGRLTETVGVEHAEMFARQQVFGALGDRTCLEALEAGATPKEVWRVVAQALDASDTPR